jgi:hypothetical protein
MADTLIKDLEQEAERVRSLDRILFESEQRRVTSLVKTAEGREALRRVLGYNFFFADEALKDGRPLVSLIVPTRSSPMPETNKAADALMRASRPHCILTPAPGVSSSVVHWARNDLLVNLRKSGQLSDYVLMMDDDMTPAPDDLIKLLAHDVDIVAGACTVRQDPPMPNFRIWSDKDFTFHTAFEWVGEGLVEVGGVGAAFMLVKTTVLDKIGEYYLSCRYEREHLGMNEEVAKRVEEGRRKVARNCGNEWWFEFLKHPWGDGEFGEDLSFCFKARACGYKVYVDTTVRPGHIGHYAFGLEDYLSYQHEVLAREASNGKLPEATGE